jgi:arylsulfatase A-like enzyme
MTDIVLIVVDTLRLKEFEIEGQDVAPFLHKMKEKDVGIDNYYSCSPWTAPAHASIFSSKLPSEHGTNTFQPYFSEENLLAKSLKERGFRTVCLSENGFISEESGYGDQFDRLDSFSPPEYTGDVWEWIWERDEDFENRIEKWLVFWFKSVISRDKASMRSFMKRFFWKLGDLSEADFNPRRTSKVLEKAKDELRRNQDVFLFMNLMPVHAPYTFNHDERNKFLRSQDAKEASKLYHLTNYLDGDSKDIDFESRRNAYKASINYVDSKIESLYEEASDDTKFIVVGDHGELFGEHKIDGKRLLGHHIGTFKELLRVPCLIFSNGGEVDLAIEDDLLYSHRDIKGMVKNLLDEEEEIGRKLIRSEYFGLKGLMEYSGRKVPEGAVKLFSRKSFSIIGSGKKYDLTSDGVYLWISGRLEEKRSLDSEKAPSVMKNKAEVLYSHHLEEDH